MNKLNTIAQLNEIRKANESRVRITTVTQLADNRKQALLDKVYDGSIELAQLLNITEPEIDMNECEAPIQIFQKIYSAGSLVGQTTVQGQNAYMADVTTDEGFEAFKDALQMLKDKDTHEAYKTVWIEGYNKFSNFNFLNGKHYVYYVVTNEEIYALRDRIKAMSKNKMTKEDARALQLDLPPFVRAWQESSIDVSKDKDKVFKMMMRQFLKTIKVYSYVTKDTKDSLDFGFDAVKGAKQASRVIPQFVLSNPARDAENPIMDLMGHVTVALENTALDFLNDKNGVHGLYAASDNSLYLPFEDCCQISKELAYFIKSIYRICYAAINEGCTVTDEEFSIMRNVIYTKAVNLGVAKEDVVKVAIATAMTEIRRVVNKDDKRKVEIVAKNASVKKFKQYPVTSIFPDEFVSVVTNKPVVITIPVTEDYVKELNRDILDNEVIEFVDGVAKDGSIELIDKITGSFIEFDGELKGIKEIYSYEETDAFLVTEDTFKDSMNKDNLKAYSLDRDNREHCDNGEYLSSVLENLKDLQVAGGKGGILVGQVDGQDKFLALMTQANNIPTNTKVRVERTISYIPANGLQKMFLLTVSR